MNAYRVIASAADCSRLAPSCGSFLPVLNPVVIPGLRAGTCCAVLRGSLLIVSKGICHLYNKELLYFKNIKTSAAHTASQS